MTDPIYVVADQYDRWGDGDLSLDIDPYYGYFTTLEEAQQFVVDFNAPILAAYTQRLEAYETKMQAWVAKNNAAKELGFRNPDHPPTNPGPPPTEFVVVEILPHEVTT